MDSPVKFSLKVRGEREVYTVEATSEQQALSILIAKYRLDPRKIEYLKKGDPKQEDLMFVAQVRAKDYTVVAPNAREALRAFAILGLDMSKLTNLRRR
jgi:hypothetical protein